MWARRRPRPLWRSLVDFLTFLIVLGSVVFVLNYFDVLDIGSGNARAKDGDSLVLNAKEVRLWGIDAPELHQSCDGPTGSYACGMAARTALRDLIRGRTISCRQLDVDRYGRSVCICRDGGSEINLALLQQGWAVAYRNPGFAYIKAEAAARAKGLGVWQGQFERPEDYRARMRAAQGSLAGDAPDD
jgi:endonuclease YncB( thermonuclease family)